MSNDYYVAKAAELHAQLLEAREQLARANQALNAKLTGVRGEMLKALELCVAVLPGLEVRSWPPGHRMKQEALNAARNAIAKAGGST